MSLSVEDRVDQVIISFVNAKKAFTTLDISNAVKADGGYFVRHREVVQVVHNKMNNSLSNINYDVSTIAVDNSQFATLYHPVGADTSTYNTSQKALSPNDVQTVRTVIPAPVPSKPWPTLSTTPAQPVAPQPKPDNVFKVRVRADGALEYPKKLVEIVLNSNVNGGYTTIEEHQNSLTINFGAMRHINHIVNYGRRIPKSIVKGRNFTKMVWHPSTQRIVVS